MQSRYKLNLKAASVLPLWALALLILSAPAWSAETCPAWAATHVRVGDQRFRVEVAASEAARAKGLSGRAALAKDAGMLFVMPAAGLHGFWMIDMAFPIDLVWIGPDQAVLAVKRLAPCGAGACPVHYAPAPATHVLEVNAGHFAGKPGDRAAWLCLP